MTKSDLLFEHEKHRSIRSNLEIRLSRLYGNYDQAFIDYQSSMEQARRERWLDSFDFTRNRQDVDACQAQINDCEAKIQKIDQILNMIENQLYKLRVPESK